MGSVSGLMGFMAAIIVLMALASLVGAVFTSLERSSGTSSSGVARQDYIVVCPSCGKEKKMTDPKLIGFWTRCPECKSRFKVDEPDVVLKGVCAGIASRMKVRPNIIRTFFVLATIVTYVVPGIVVYIVLIFVGPQPVSEVESQPQSSNPQQKKTVQKPGTRRKRPPGRTVSKKT